MSSSDKPQLFPEEREGLIVENETSSSQEKEKDKATVSDGPSEKKIREDDDDDGFKTPDQRIPAITQCPPAPKKPRPPPSKRKRKASPPPGACRSLQFEASATAVEVESLFRPISDDQDDKQDRKIKRARTDDDHKEDPS